MAISKMITGYGYLLGLAGGFLALGAISSYCLTLSAAYALTLGSVWYECLENGKMLVSWLVPPLPAYPMWGYCFVVALMEKWSIIFQALLGFFFIAYCYATCRRAIRDPLKTYPSTTEQIILGILLIPWFFLVTTTMTKSMASLLICIGTCLLYKGALDKNIRLVILAGLSLGLGYNFRTEIIVLASLYLIILLVHLSRIGFDLRSKLKYLLSFAFAFIIFTIPWLVYTKLTLGHYRLSSTNSSAVIYLGLGTIPKNPWNIIANDDYVWKIATENNINTPWGFEANQLFSNKIIEAITDHPTAFLLRVIKGWQLMFVQGLYFPDFRQFLLIDSSNDKSGLTQDYIAYDFLNEKLKETLRLKIDEMKLERYRSEGIGFHNVKLWQWAALIVEYSVRGFFALIFICTLGLLVFRAMRSRSRDLRIGIPMACLGFELLIAGFIQTLPSHTTQIWPVLLMFQLQSDTI